MEDEDEVVLGIPIGDPEVLKASQFILVCAGITAFFLAIELAQVIEYRSLRDLSRNEAALWVFDTVRAFFLVVSGYAGVKRSSRCLLGSFFVVCIVSCIAGVAQGAYDIGAKKKFGPVAMEFLEASFFVLAAHFSRVLWSQASTGKMLTERPTNSDSASYSLLGLPMTDLKVLRATQMVFTALGIESAIFGSVVVMSAESAITTAGLGSWLFMVSMLVILMYTGYFGVKRSSAGLLSLFVFMSMVLGGFSLIFAISFAISCGFLCVSFTLFWVGVTLVFIVAARNAQFLRQRAASGTELTGRRQSEAAHGLPGPEVLGVIEGDGVELAKPSSGTPQFTAQV